MKIICSCCRTSLGEKEPLDDESFFHGMCNECTAHFEKQWEDQSFGEYLDNFDYPVFVVGGDGCIAAANQKMSDTLGKNEIYLRPSRRRGV